MPEVVPLEQRKRTKSAIFLLPSLVTCASLFFGFLSIKYSFDARLFDTTQNYYFAAWCIFAALVCDTLDGSIARLTHTQSSFGVQLDSLCDAISFGVAPMVLAYQFALHDFTRLGFGVAFVFVACGILRLARFNVQSSLGKVSGAFTGLPIPAAACAVTVLILAHMELDTMDLASQPPWVMSLLGVWQSYHMFGHIFLLVVTLLLSFGMISTFEYMSHKSIKLPRKKPFRYFALIVIVGALMINLQLTVSLMILTLAYCLHGPVLWLFTRKDRDQEEEELFDIESDHHT
jgi:CDP-diacylglycerol--serine O-phosphatidyltransferase